MRWLHSHLDEPVEIWAELDGDRGELRKVEVLRDGRLGWADRTSGSGPTHHAVEPWPPIAEIGADPQFLPVDVTEAEFERLWNQARRGAPVRSVPPLA